MGLLSAKKYSDVNVLHCGGVTHLSEFACFSGRSRCVETGHLTKAEKNFLELKNLGIYCISASTEVPQFCNCSCFEQKVDISTTGLIVGSIKAEKLSLSDYVGVVDDKSSSGNIMWSPMKLKTLVKNKALTSMVQILTESGRNISVTSGHYLVKFPNQVVPAKDISLGDALVTLQGERDQIRSLCVKEINSNLVNFSVLAEEGGGRIIGANGLLAADAAWVNSKDLLHKRFSERLAK